MCYVSSVDRRKDRILPPGAGYGRQLPSGVWVALRSGDPASIVIHATHGRSGSIAVAEARYLQTATKVSAHYLIGRDGLVYSILPDEAQAWHAGSALALYTNDRSIGIEIHAAETEPLLPVQRELLTSLTRWLMARWIIPVESIETHREIARPPGRKSDPACLTDAEFAAWRAAL